MEQLRLDRTPPANLPSVDERDRHLENWLIGLVVACSAFVMVQASATGAKLLARAFGWTFL